MTSADAHAWRVSQSEPFLRQSFGFGGFGLAPSSVRRVWTTFSN
jgi:hypothetical protein